MNYRIKKIRVTKLFGLFDHEINMHTDANITIIHGPNGFGKTSLLKLLSGVLGDRDVIRNIPFKEFCIEFIDGLDLCVTKQSDTKQSDINNVPPNMLEFTLKSNNKVLNTFKENYRFKELYTNYNNTLRNMLTNNLTYKDLKNRIKININNISELVEDDKWLKEIKMHINIRFIETQRLLSLRSGQQEKIKQSVTNYSEELADIIKTKLAESATLSQSLDRTFPIRLLQRGFNNNLTENEVRNKFNNIDKQRHRLMTTGLLDNEGEIFEVPTKLDEHILRVLSVYIDDTENKLNVFNDLAARIELFKQIINDHFLYKQISFSKDKGFVFITSDGTPLTPKDLSSGEQHELVVLYELLFKANKGSLILIDEPEISLHIAWQDRFLKDIMRITNLLNHDVIIATHSPQIINNRWDLTEELKGPKQ